MATAPHRDQEGAVPDRRHGTGRVYRQLVRALNALQAGLLGLFWFVPDHSVLRQPRYQHVLVAQTIASLALASISFGAVIGTVRTGGTVLQTATVGVAAIIPAAFLGLWGGKIASALPKRLAIGGPYAIIGALCVTVPFVFGVNFPAMVLLVFAVNAVAQIAGPAERAILPYIATEEQYAAGVSIINFGTSAGNGLAVALVAPLLLVWFGVRAVFVVSGALLLIAATRAFEVPPEKEQGTIDWSLRGTSPKAVMNWLLDHFAVCTMVLLAVLAGTSNRVMQNLAPAYVRDGLDTDPALSAFVFAPATLGMVVAMAAGPWLTHRLRPRGAAVVGFLAVAVGLVLMGLVHKLTPLVSPWNPLQLLRLLGADVSDQVLAAGLFTIPIGFGTTVTALAVQTYINSKVEEDKQAGTFSIQSTLVNWFAILPLLLLGALATEIGPEPVMFILPGVMVVSAAVLLWFGFRYTDRDGAPKAVHVLTAFVREPEPEPDVNADGAISAAPREGADRGNTPASHE